MAVKKQILEKYKNWRKELYKDNFKLSGCFKLKMKRNRNQLVGYIVSALFKKLW